MWSNLSFCEELATYDAMWSAAKKYPHGIACVLHRYAAGATIQLILFAVLSVQVKRVAPGEAMPQGIFRVGVLVCLCAHIHGHMPTSVRVFLDQGVYT
jgi:hypothetical protein